ncbi:MAG TPA: MFS transporter [Noviherbaspirillum sp.]|uniref:MFS transporter n=1 Tax=Noviherbaspirillum sp. TaxID=1926288 RepID=UPI002B497C2A|nr:MFS transporter [Noviherbaspirillum sp.]HJV87490.1 MFS transporter [Noviherbaspirillum sp.]
MHRQASDSQRNALFRSPNFRWMAAGSIISMLGDQFTLIALPWLVLKMTGDTLVLGTVLAVMSIPRALFILVGGALVDRHSPKRVLMLTKHVNTLLLGTLAALVLTGHLDLAMVYGLALAIGLSTAFSIPAGTSIMPHVVPREQLQTANGIFMGIRQMSMFAGPLLAGLLIALFSDGGDGSHGVVKDARGLGLAFLFDAFSFALSAWTLARVATREAAHGPAVVKASVWKSVGEGLRYCWKDDSLRVCFTYWAAVAFFITGPVQVAVPVLAGHIGEGAAAFGALAGAHGAGTLLGMALTGAKPHLRFGSFGMTILVIDGIIGILFMPLGLIDMTWQGVALLLVIGTLSGFLQVNVYTWLQHHAAPAMLGRTMSLFMFIFMGIAPMSSAITGWLMRSISLQQLFAGSGALLVLIVGVALLASGMRSISDARADTPR